jgi:NADH dehydrogenase FAD-containing subunit
MNMSRPSVTIVGAGVTGLSCAFDLAEYVHISSQTLHSIISAADVQQVRDRNGSIG